MAGSKMKLNPQAAEFVAHNGELTHKRVAGKHEYIAISYMEEVGQLKLISTGITPDSSSRLVPISPWTGPMPVCQTSNPSLNR